VERFELYAGGLYNAGGGTERSVSLQELTAICEEVTGNRITVGSEAETRPADLRLFVTDHRRLTAAGGWRPQRGVRAAAADIHEWIRREETSLRPLLGQ
jgi:CDP-paratose 2-epimerase